MSETNLIETHEVLFYFLTLFHNKPCQTTGGGNRILAEGLVGKMKKKMLRTELEHIHEQID